jgi:hypothetical protein
MIQRRLTRTAPRIGGAAVAVLAWACTPSSLDCSRRPTPECDPDVLPCTADVDPCRYIPPGATNTLVDIDSSPTTANIYVNGEYVGRTPLKRYLWFSSTTRAVTVIAEPLFPGQARQEQQLNVPPLPKRLTFFMNNPPEAKDTVEPTQ